MRRAAHVAGLMEIRGNGKCILELRQITPSTVSESSGAASSNEMPVPDSAKLFGDVKSGAVCVHSTKMGVTKKESSTTSTICSAMQEFFGEPTVRGIMHSNSDFTHGYLRKRRAQRPKPSRTRPPRTRTQTTTSKRLWTRTPTSTTSRRARTWTRMRRTRSATRRTWRQRHHGQ